MRGWGFTFLITAAGCVILASIAEVLAFILIGLVAVAALGALASDYADRRVQRELTQAAQTNVDRDYFRFVAEMPDDKQIKWARIPGQRRPGPAS